MTLITDYDEFIELQRSYPRSFSNDYYLPGVVRKLIEHRLLRYSADERALFLFEKREGFTKLVFRLRDDTPRLAPCDEPLAAYLLYRKGNPPETAAAWLRGQGFRFASTSAHYKAEKITGTPTPDGVESATADETYAMLGDYFSAAEVDLPSRELFESALCIRSGDGMPVGILYSGQTLAVAVTPEMRGRGLGRSLYLAYAAKKLAENKNAMFYEWIRQDNASSIAMFTKLGFSPDGAMTDLYER